MGESIPVNEKLSEIFLQLHISEKSGRGVPKIIETYGKGARATAVLYTLVESAKANRLDIYEYLKYLLEEMPNNRHLEHPET